MYIYYIYTHAQEETRRDVFFLGVLMWLGKGSLQEVGIVEKRWWGFPPPYFPRVVLFNQSQCQGWGRGDGGVAGQAGMREQRGYIRGISTFQLG